MSSGALVPLPADVGLPDEVAGQTAGWRAPDPWEPLALVLPARLRREHGTALAALGWVARSEPATLPERAFGLTPERLAALRAGPALLFRRHPAWLALAGRTPAQAQAAAEAELGALVGRVARERELLAVGDLLQACAAPATPAAAAWVRFQAARLGGDPAPLLALLRADLQDPGVSPLTEVALGAALAGALLPAPWSDPELEARLARLCLAAPGPTGAGTAAAPLAVPRLEPPPAVAELLGALHRAAAGEDGPPTGLGLEARLRDVARARRGDLSAAGRLAGAGPELLLALAVDHALTLEPGPRRRLWRRLTPQGAPAVELVLPELGGLDRLVSGLAGPAARHQALLAALEARLSELEAEPEPVAAPERERARVALEALPAGARAGLERLELWLASGRPEAPGLALSLLRRATTGALDPGGPVASTALRVLVDAGRAPFPDDASGPGLALLLRWHALRTRLTGGQLPEPLLERLVRRTPEGCLAGADAAGMDGPLLAEVLGQALTLEGALALLARLPGPPGALPVRQRGPGRFDGLLREPGAAALPVLAWSGGDPAWIEALAGRADPALELPTRLAPSALDPADRHPVGPRLGGVPLGDDPRRGPLLCRRVAAAHALGLALLHDPRRCARVLPEGGLGLADLDLACLTDPQRRAAAQARDRGALRALIARWSGQAPATDDPQALAAHLEAALARSAPAAPLLALPAAEARAFLEDALPGRGPLSPEQVAALLPPALRELLSAPEDLRELLHDLREEAWAGDELEVHLDPAGAITVARRAPA